MIVLLSTATFFLILALILLAFEQAWGKQLQAELTETHDKYIRARAANQAIIAEARRWKEQTAYAQDRQRHWRTKYWICAFECEEANRRLREEISKNNASFDAGVRAAKEGVE